MCVYSYYIAGGLSTVLLLLLFPFWKPKKSGVSVLVFGKAGTPFKNSELKKDWLNPIKFKKLLAWLSKHQFTTITTEELAKENKWPGRTVLLAFTGGFQSFYTEIFPLLKEKKMKATVFLPVEYIGQFNAWQNPETEPFQNILTGKQIAEMHTSGLVNFASDTLDYTDLNTVDLVSATWQARESKLRLKNLYNLEATALHYPLAQPKTAALQETMLKEGYAFTIGHKKGLNPQPLDFSEPLKAWPLAQIFPLWRLYFKLTRG